MACKNILLAEDDPEHAALIRRAIEKADCSCEIVTVRDGTETIEYLFATGSHADRDPNDLPDLILLDLKMPKMNGLEVLQILRRARFRDRRKFPPVVVLTSSRYMPDTVQAYDLGAHSFICKPTDFSELVEAVRKVVDYWLVLNVYPPPRESRTRGKSLS